MQYQNQILCLCGPTASGKSQCALDIAPTLNAVIINCDSKQIYQEIPIITAQPSQEELQMVPHRLYGCVSAAENVTVDDWVGMVVPEIQAVWQSGKLPLLVGGTGLYVKALVEGMAQFPEIDASVRNKTRALARELGAEGLYAKLAEKDPSIVGKLQPGDRQRVARAYEVLEQTGKSITYWQAQEPELPLPEAEFKVLFLDVDRQETYERCHTRFDWMLEHGVMDEMKALDAMQLDPNLPAMKSHGVPELLAYLHGEMESEDAVVKAKQNTRNYIKRQFTWFRHQLEGVEFVSRDGVERFLNGS